MSTRTSVIGRILKYTPRLTPKTFAQRFSKAVPIAKMDEDSFFYRTMTKLENPAHYKHLKEEDQAKVVKFLSNLHCIDELFGAICWERGNSTSGGLSPSSILEVLEDEEIKPILDYFNIYKLVVKRIERFENCEHAGERALHFLMVLVDLLMEEMGVARH